VQGGRGIVRAAARNPKVFSYKVAQVGVLASALYLTNKHTNPECWEQISEREKVNNWIITTPFSFTDKDGNVKYYYFKIAKDQGQRIFATLFENLMAKYEGEEINTDQISQAMQDAIPIIPTDLLPPTIDAIMGYSANKDFWRKKDIWKGPKVKPKEEYTRYTHPSFVGAGEITGLSPERTKYALGQFFTQGNIYTSLAGYAWKQILDELPEREKNMVTEEILLNKPFVRRIINETDPWNKRGKSLKEAELEVATDRYILTRDFDKLSQAFYEKTADKKEIVDFIKKAPPEERRRLLSRHLRNRRLQAVPERRWWLNLGGMPPEARATVFWTRWLASNEAERKTLERYARTVPGISSKRFFQRFRKLRNKEKKEG